MNECGSIQFVGELCILNWMCPHYSAVISTLTVFEQLNVATYLYAMDAE
jgi:hypothetical protein